MFCQNISLAHVVGCILHCQEKQPAVRIVKKQTQEVLKEVGYNDKESTQVNITTRVKRMQRSGTEAIRTQIRPSKQKREINKTKNSQNTKRTYGQPSEQLFPKRWPLSNSNRTKIL